jgi:hypothetical protein
VGKRSWRSELCGKLPGDGLNPDVIGDVALELRCWKTKIAIFLRQRTPGMIGQKHDSTPAVAFDDLERCEERVARHGLPAVAWFVKAVFSSTTCRPAQCRAFVNLRIDKGIAERNAQRCD